MSISNSSKLHLLDPTVFNTNRCEFRLPDGHLSSAIKLIDVGVSNSLLNASTGQYYPTILGVLASIRKLTLYSDSTILDETQELAARAAIQHLRTTNQGSEDMMRFELHNGTNLSINEAGAYTMEPDCKDYFNQGNATANYVQRNNNQFQISATADGNSGALNLADYLSMLESIPVLPRIPNLRLLIEWNTTSSDFFEQITMAGVAKVYTPIRPTLVIEELVGLPDEVGPIKVPYLQTIAERFPVPATTNGVAQAASFRSTAFVGRYLKDVMFFNRTTTADGFMLSKQRSPAMYKEKLQLVVNGSKYLPDTGIDQESQKIQYFNDTYGPLNVPLWAALPDLVDLSGYVHDAGSEPLESNFSVAGVSVEAVIERLDVEYGRTGRGVIPSAQVAGFDLIVFGRIARLMELQNGKIRLSY